MMNITFQWFSWSELLLKRTSLDKKHLERKWRLYSLFLRIKRWNLSITRISGEKKPLKTKRPVDVRRWPAYDPFFPVESRAKAQSGHKDLPKQVRGNVSLFKYSKAHLQITFVIPHISSLANCIHPLLKREGENFERTLRRRGGGEGV